MPSKKANLKDYIDTVQSVKPSAEVVFGRANEDGETIVESIASKEYEAIIESDEVQEAAEEVKQQIREQMGPTTGDLLAKIDEIAEENPLQEIKEDLQEIVEDAVPVVNPELSPVSGNMDTPEIGHEEVEPQVQMKPDVALILEALTKLVDKIDNMQNFTPVIHVPAPVIHVTLPETRKTVTRAIERDDKGWMTNVKETIEEVPEGEPLIEIKEAEEQPKPKRRQRKKKVEE